MSSLSTLTKSVTAFPKLRPPILQHRTPSLKMKLEVFSPPCSQHKGLTVSSTSISCSSSISQTTSRVNSVTSFSPVSSSVTENRHWMVYMERPPEGVNTKSEVISYYVKTLQRVMGSEKDAQMCIYNASWESHFGFCCNIDEELSRDLACLPGVQLVTQDPNFDSPEKDYSFPNNQGNKILSSQSNTTMLFPARNTKHWLVRLEKPGIGVVTKAQMVDYYVQILSKILGNETDSQMCIYHVSWKSNFGFCCELDEDCARKLAGLRGVLSVHPDHNFESDIKDYEGNDQQSLVNALTPAEESQTTPVRTKKLFITGLSFYTSEKTLRAAFEGFGELVEVKIIMDKISKRSKGYAFVEYTTEEAASAALKEMNGKIINGWMIVVDVAKNNSPKYSRGRPR